METVPEDISGSIRACPRRSRVAKERRLDRPSPAARSPCLKESCTVRSIKQLPSVGSNNLGFKKFSNWYRWGKDWWWWNGEDCRCPTRRVSIPVASSPALWRRRPSWHWKRQRPCSALRRSQCSPSLRTWLSPPAGNPTAVMLSPRFFSLPYRGVSADPYGLVFSSCMLACS